ncbi:hypothetical protein Ahy_B03g063431 isoform B [Arachis hypogaea]|uniref:Uncharacterized protein n=1 Tax=Arachis hypogaea TaxID=3818 RepID=A0A444ZXB0_ARAHY|nr:hypothetical protein Ahy_B03g063431 isoform B [Arachis hypogaea]
MVDKSVFEQPAIKGQSLDPNRPIAAKNKYGWRQNSARGEWPSALGSLPWMQYAVLQPSIDSFHIRGVAVNPVSKAQTKNLNFFMKLHQYISAHLALQDLKSSTYPSTNSKSCGYNSSSLMLSIRLDMSFRSQAYSLSRVDEWLPAIMQNSSAKSLPLSSMSSFDLGVKGFLDEDDREDAVRLQLIIFCAGSAQKIGVVFLPQQAGWTDVIKAAADDFPIRRNVMETTSTPPYQTQKLE